MNQPGRSGITLFTDIAIAVILAAMLLVLRLPDPPADAPMSSDQVAAMVATYAAGFVVLAIIWINHRQLLRLVPRSGTRVVVLNGMLLFCVALLPAAIFHLGGHFGEAGATALYAAALMLASGAFTLIRGSAIRAMRRSPQFQGFQRQGIKLVLAGCGVYGLAALAALVSVDMAAALLVLATLLFAGPLLVQPGRQGGAAAGGGRRLMTPQDDGGGPQHMADRAQARAEFEKLIPGGKNEG